jgi:hypothetical protein
VTPAEQREQAHAWYRRTEHCHGCGCPGEFCLCRTPCVCAELHEVGSGIGRDAADVYSENVVEQDELFGGEG